jgi:hypothetical protein
MRLPRAVKSTTSATPYGLPVPYVTQAGPIEGISLATLVQVAVALPGPQDPQPETPDTENMPAPLIKGKSQNINHQDNWLDEDNYLLNADAVNCPTY